jgi:hypothetical protein
MSDAIQANNMGELEALARALLPRMAYDYYSGGATDEITLRENRAAYERIALLPRMLIDVSARDMGATRYPTWDRRAQSNGLWCPRSFHRSPDSLGTGRRW